MRMPRRHAGIGDEVYIVVDGVSEAYSGNPPLYVTSTMPEFDGGKGVLQRDQIVGYNLKQPPMYVFRTPRAR